MPEGEDRETNVALSILAIKYSVNVMELDFIFYNPWKPVNV